MEVGSPPSVSPHTPHKTTGTKDTPSETPNGMKYRAMFEDMKARYNELRKSCNEQTIVHKKIMAEKDQTITELKTQVEKPCVMKMCNEDAFVSKLRKGATGPTKGCGVSGCDTKDVDLIRCGLCDTLVCEECSGVKIAKLRPIMNQCKTLYFSCPGCNIQISDKTTMTAYDVLKEKVQTLTEELQNCELEKDKLIQQQQHGGDATHQKKVADIQALLAKKTEETVKLVGENNNLRNEIKTGNGAGNDIEAILNKRLDKIENSIDQIITKKLEDSMKGVTEIGQKIDNAIATNKKTFAEALGGNVTDSLTTAFRNRKNQEIVNEAEREKRSANLIVHGVNEPNIESQKEDDESFVSSLLEKIGVVQRPKHIFRLGPRTEEKTRPVKLVMESENVKDTIMSRLGNLKNAEDAFRKISIREDYSIEEREMVHEMVKKAAEKNAAENTQEWKVRGTPKTGLRLVRITKRQ